MSALPPKADIALHRSECPLCAKSGHSALQYRTPLFDHERGLVGILSVEGAPNPDIYNGQTMTGMGH